MVVVELAIAVEGEAVVVLGLGGQPVPVRPVRHEGLVDEVVVHGRRAVLHGLGQQLGPFALGLERRAWLDADAGQHPDHGCVLGLGRLLVDHLGQ
jgi:hypothetical protein